MTTRSMRSGARRGRTIGALLTGVSRNKSSIVFGVGSLGWARRALGAGGQSDRGHTHRLTFAIVGTLVLLKVTDMITGLRVTEEQEIEGLDITQHGEEAYNLEA